ncbi:hypothetical protein KR018_005397, partial [Drosophila ironensis]
ILDETIEEGTLRSAARKNAKKQKAYFELPWYIAPGIVLFWALLFVSVVKPLFYRLPEPLTVEYAGKGGFIAERAYANLYDFGAIGPKVVGSDNNEIKTVEFLLKELNLIKENLNTDLFTMEIDVQRAYGAYVKWNLVNMYQGIQNVVVKLSAINATSETYLLINSHFDSQPTSPSTGDDGHMVVSVLEVLRVIATGDESFEHPIIFLFNGSEENSMQASHGFIAHHKWAPYCKGLINLDAAGSGGREITFQTGPNQPWLVDSYKKNAKHYFATVMAEEIFQAGLVPSYTDYDILVDYGNVIGLDVGECINGFVYHTKYDSIDVIPRSSLQNTGDNLLSLVRSLSNAAELRDIDSNTQGKTVFFDVLGLYFIKYSEETGVKLNYAVAAATIILVYLSLGRTASISKVSTGKVFGLFILVLVLQVIAFVLALALPIAMAYGLDKYGYTLSYFATSSLVVGLYICPCLVGLALPSYIYLKFQENDKISYAQHVQFALHGHSIVLSLLVIALTYYGLRTTYTITWTLIFYVVPLALNLLTTLHDRGFSWSGVVKAFQLAPFLYNSYLCYTFIVILTPMMGRYGLDTNPDLYIGVLTALGTILSLGFLILLLHTTRRSGLVLLGLVAITAAAVYVASSTELGFPYRPKTNVQRIPYVQARRIFYEYDGTVSKDDSGYLFNFQDRRGYKPLVDAGVNLTGLVSMEADCNKYMFCGVPLYDHRWVESMTVNMWLPRENPVYVPGNPVLTLLNRTILDGGETLRLEFSVNGTDHTSIFIQPEADVTVKNWSFLPEYLTSQTPPYHIYFSYGIDKSDLKFYVELQVSRITNFSCKKCLLILCFFFKQKPDKDYDVPCIKVGISVHYMQSEGDEEAIKFSQQFPKFGVIIQWPAIYKRYIF